MRWLAGSILLATLVASGCGLGAGSVAVRAASCENVPSGACSEQVQRATAGLSGAQEVDIRCGDGVTCTRAGGSGLAEVRFANGQKLTRAWSYVGDTGPAPVVLCIGVAQGPLCQSALEGETELVSPSKHIAAVTVTCTSASCTAAAGKVTVRIVLGDGSIEDHDTGWSVGPG